jgi:hypothetical protein
MPSFSGTITSAVQYDSLVAFDGQTNIVVNGGNGDARISINNSVITITNPGSGYTDGIAIIGGGTRIVITVATSSTIKLKRSSIPGRIPASADLDFGEVAINYQDGIIYYKKPDGSISAIGGSGGSGGSIGRSITEITASSGQTVFTTTGPYTVGFIDVILNGSQLSSSDFTATNGTTITLNQAAAAGDSVRLVSYDAVSLANTYRKSEVDSLVNETAIVMAIALG